MKSDKTTNAVAIFNKYASEYQDKFMNTAMYHDTFDFFCDALNNEKAGILELACGPGNITRYLLAKNPEFKILGIDLAPGMLKLAKENNPSAEFKLMDCRTISGLDKKFDAIMCGFCLPYLNKEEALKLIVDASNLLNGKGIFYISTMEDEYINSGYKKGSSGDEIFMHYFEADFLKESLNRNGFEIMHLSRKNYLAGDKTPITDLILIARLIQGR